MRPQKNNLLLTGYLLTNYQQQTAEMDRPHKVTIVAFFSQNPLQRHHQP